MARHDWYCPFCAEPVRQLGGLYSQLEREGHIRRDAKRMLTEIEQQTAGAAK